MAIPIPTERPCPSEPVANSTSGAFTDWCGQTEPAIVMQSQTDGPEVAVLVFQDFTLAQDSTLQLEGDYPVILAVLGDATIAGIVDEADVS